jgi:hypothetical protein
MTLTLQHRDHDNGGVWRQVAQMGPLDGPSVHQARVTKLEEIH